MTIATEAVIQAGELTKIFRDFWRRPKVRAVNGVSFEVRRGEVFGLLGPNGSGKSTTLKMILGLLHPTHGTLRVFGHSPRDVRTKARVGYLPEESYLYPHLSSEETLDFYGRLFDLSPADRRKRINQLLEMIGLKHARNRVVGEFSKGMARRIGLAQALINDPDLVILDEPTSGMDPIGCRQIKDLILTLAGRGKTIVMSSHLLADVEDVCDRIAILYNGRVQAVGMIGDLLEEKSRCRVTIPQLDTETFKQVLATLRAAVGEEPFVDHPRRDLEQFFLEVVEKARRASAEQSGVGPSEGVAGYLSRQPGSADNVLDQLVFGTGPSDTPPPNSPPTEPPQDEAEINRKLRKLMDPPADDKHQDSGIGN